MKLRFATAVAAATLTALPSSVLAQDIYDIYNLLHSNASPPARAPAQINPLCVASGEEDLLRDEMQIDFVEMEEVALNSDKFLLFVKSEGKKDSYYLFAKEADGSLCTVVENQLMEPVILDESMFPEKREEILPSGNNGEIPAAYFSEYLSAQNALPVIDYWGPEGRLIATIKSGMILDVYEIAGPNAFEIGRFDMSEPPPVIVSPPPNI
jgi:hypothetical protein